MAHLIVVVSAVPHRTGEPQVSFLKSHKRVCVDKSWVINKEFRARNSNANPSTYEILHRET